MTSEGEVGNRKEEAATVALEEVEEVSERTGIEVDDMRGMWAASAQ